MTLDWLKGTKTLKQIEKEFNEDEKEPVDIKDLEGVIELINVAKEVNCSFTLKLLLEIGEFIVQSDNFKSIKLLKANKTQSERLVITHTNALITMDTTIEAKHIVGINFTLTFKNMYESDVNV